MKAFFIGLFLAFTCLSSYGQDNDFYQQGESLISISNPKLGIQGARSEWVSIVGTNLDYGYFLRDRYLIGAGIQGYYSNIDEPNNDSYFFGLHLFSRYYFAPFGKKDQFILFAETRIGATLNLAQSVVNNGDFRASHHVLLVEAGIHCAWRPLDRLSFALGVQPQVSFIKGIDPAQQFGNPIFNPLGVLSMNFHL